MITTVGRIVTREAGQCGRDDGLIIGMVLKTGVGILKPHTVYNIIDVNGSLVLKEVGESFAKEQWRQGHDVHYILGVFNRTFILTKDEIEGLEVMSEEDAEI